MSNADLAILVVIAFCGVMGLYWGLIRQVLAIAGFFAGIALAIAYNRQVADLLSSWISEDVIAQVVAFIAIMLAVSAAASLIASLLRNVAGLLFLGWVDHAAGALLGILQGGLICAAVLIVIASLPAQLWSSVLAGSQIAPTVVQIGGSILLPLLPPSFQAAKQILTGMP